MCKELKRINQGFQGWKVSKTRTKTKLKVHLRTVSHKFPTKEEMDLIS